MFLKILKNLLNRLKIVFESGGFVMGGDLHKNNREGALHRAWGHVFTNHLSGDYVEFGVYQGDSFVESHKQYLIFRRWLTSQTGSSESWRREVAAKFIKSKVKFHGLDTFSGMPENDEENITFGEGTFFAEISNVNSKCLAQGMNKEEFYLYKGLFKDTESELKKNISDKVAIINIDGDLYESAKDSFAIIEKYLQVGTVILIDDYNAFNADNLKGERRAFAEFSETSRFKFEKWFPYQYSGQAFLCVEDDKKWK